MGDGHHTPPPSKKTRCGVCGRASRTFYDQRPRRVRNISCGDRRVYLDLSVRRVDCRGCGGVKREQLDWLANNPLYTKRFAFSVGRRCRDSTVQAVAEELHLDWHTGPAHTNLLIL
ncbi:MAG: transposase family protein [Planctomycetaceae bacterium]|nr:transposase family protein [Planctomycetaceae bacterium]